REHAPPALEGEADEARGAAQPLPAEVAGRAEQRHAAEAECRAEGRLDLRERGEGAAAGPVQAWRVAREVDGAEAIADAVQEGPAGAQHARQLAREGGPVGRGDAPVAPRPGQVEARVGEPPVEDRARARRGEPERLAGVAVLAQAL